MFIKGMQDEMTAGLDALNREMPKNPDVRIVAHKKGGGLSWLERVSRCCHAARAYE